MQERAWLFFWGRSEGGERGLITVLPISKVAPEALQLGGVERKSARARIVVSHARRAIAAVSQCGRLIPGQLGPSEFSSDCFFRFYASLFRWS